MFWLLLDCDLSLKVKSTTNVYYWYWVLVTLLHELKGSHMSLSILSPCQYFFGQTPSTSVKPVENSEKVTWKVSMGRCARPRVPLDTGRWFRRQGRPRQGRPYTLEAAPACHGTLSNQYSALSLNTFEHIWTIGATSHHCNKAIFIFCF